MTRNHRRHLRRLQLPLIAAAILWLVSTTAASHSMKDMLQLLLQQGDLALTILRAQLYDDPLDDPLPAAVTLVISQSPLLLSGRDAVLALRRSEEPDTDSAPPSTLPDHDTSPITETADPPDIPLVIADNGVSARTLVPTSPDGYIVSGNVYIHNRSDRTVDPAALTACPATSITASAAPQVLIVHTHGSEAYTMPPGVEYVPCSDCRTTDISCSVVRVGAEIAAVLENAGISVLHDTTLHDYPQYSGAYNRSLTTIENYLSQYPTISLVLDIHRDAVTDSSGTMYKVVSGVAGVNAAQMSFVIGTDGGGLPHPNWPENLNLAVAIQENITRDYPTLMRPITVRNSRYNQHTTPGTLLVEMGAAGNSLDEALFSARILADAILETIARPAMKPLPIPEIS